MKKIFSMILLITILFLNTNVFALSPNEVKVRGTVCTEEGKQIELALAKENGTLVTKTCFDTYQNAKKEMDNLQDEEGSTFVIIEDGMIIDAEYALIDYDQTSDTKYTNVYSDKDLKTRITYIKTTASTSDDAVMLELDYTTKRIKMKVNDMVGWIPKYEYEGTKTNILYDIVPISWVKSANYYEVTEEKIIHQLPGNIYGNKSAEPLPIGPKPEMLEVGIYYSYDGHYFYQDLKTLIQDYKNNTYTSSINKDNPYYNYYQYVSFRTKTNYNADNINQYLKENTSSDSKLYNTGELFIKYQDLYGINAALMLSIGINESGWGKSNIAQTKNNLFGLNAVDQTPGESANYFKTVEDCINDYAYTWLSYGYVQPGDARFKGANLGTKGEGLNVHYASDVYWGEIAASYYYQFDKYFGLQDYNAYEIAVLKENQDGKVYAYKTPNGEKVSNDFYQYKVKSSAVAVLDTINDEKSGKVWYKIMSDPTLDENLNYIGSSKSVPRVEYNATKNQVYVEASFFLLTNKKVEEEEEKTPEEQAPSVTPTPTPTPEVTPTPIPTPTPTPTPTPVPDTPIETIIKEAGFEQKDGYLLKITNGLTKEELIKKLSIHNAKIKIDGEKLVTGGKITITSGKLEKTLSIIVYGDTNGDGNISAVDYVKIKNHIMGTTKLEGAYLKAADVNKDGNISAVDYVKIKNYIMGDKTQVE